MHKDLKEISNQDAINKMITNEIEHLPLVDSEGICKGIYVKDEIIFDEKV